MIIPDVLSNENEETELLKTRNEKINQKLIEGSLDIILKCKFEKGKLKLKD